MRIDLQQFRQILNVFLESNTTDITIKELDYCDSDNKFKDDFLFHFQLIIENGMISKRSLEPIYTLDDAGVGIDLNGNVYINIIPLRLTQAGHDFANTLNSKDVFEKLKENFSDKPFEIILDTGQALLKHYTTKKLDQILSL